MLERRASDQAHREKQAVLGLAGLVHRNDVLVIERGLQLTLALEPGAEPRVVAQLGSEQLQRHDAIQRELSRAVHDAHSALTKLAIDSIPGDDRTRG